MSDEARKRILARRARFVAAAIASLGVASCDKPQPCLSVTAIPPPSTSTKEAPEAVDASAPDTTAPDTATEDTLDANEAGASDAIIDVRPETTKATPCLKIAPPHPCLKMAPENFDP